MKKILLALCCAVLVLGACKKDPKAGQILFNFMDSSYELTDDGALTVTVTSSAAVKENIDLGFTTGGSAVEGTDYTLSAESFSFAAGDTEATVTFTSISVNKENLDIELTLKAPYKSGYALGSTSQTKISVPAKELIYYNFNTTDLDLASRMTVTLNLVTEADGTGYKADSEFHIPFTVTSDAVAGTDYDILEDVSEFVFEKGTNSASVTLVSYMTTIPDPAPVITIAIDEDEIPEAYRDYFAAGINSTFNVRFGALSFNDLIGKWSYSSFPILDDAEADRATLEMLTADAGDNLDDLPHNNTSSDMIEFKEEDGKNVMKTSLSGDLANYFMDCEVSDIVPETYEWYYYYPARPLNAVSATLSKVNYNFSGSSTDEKEASIYLGITSSSSGRQLHVFVRNYQPTDFFTGIYAYGEHLVWDMYIDYGYWDIYYVFNEVTE